MQRKRRSEKKKESERIRVADFPGTSRVMRIAYLTGGFVCIAAVVIAISVYVRKMRIMTNEILCDRIRI